MLKKIKSIFYIRLLFTYLDEGRKLKIIRNNKSLQKDINISIINYKFFSGKYIIYKSNDFGEEYDGYDDNLIYNGNYLNGKKEGIGVEFSDDGYICSKGEYKNGKKNGRGVEFTIDGQVGFEGEYKEGKKNGKGIDYYDKEKNILIFEGEYLNDKIWNGTRFDREGNVKFILKNNISGNVKEYFVYGDCIEYEGEYLNGKRNGKGKEYDFNGKLIFEGEYLNGQRNGKGKEYYANGILAFEGEFLNDKKWNGLGYDLFKNRLYILKEGKGFIKEYNSYNYTLEFEGEYSNGNKNGIGRKYHDTGKIYFEGEYLNGERNGKGKEYYKDGKIKFEGEYLYNHKRKGKFYINEKLEYEGEFLFEKKWNGKGYDEYGNIIYELVNGNGKVREYGLNSKLYFEGEYLDGKRNGIGKEYCSDILIFVGEYLNGQRNGKGKEYFVNGLLIYEGEYSFGRRNGNGKEYDLNGQFIFEGKFKNGERV